MRLREQVALKTFVAAGVFVPAFYVGHQYLRMQAADRQLAAAIASVISGEELRRCEASPATFGGGSLDPLPPIGGFRSIVPSTPQIFAYDPAFQSANRAAPVFPADLKAALMAGADQPSGNFDLPSSVGRHLAARVSSTGACAILLSRFGPLALPKSTEWYRLGVVLAAFISAAVVTAGRLVARIRRLGAAVRASADSGYAVGVPVTGVDELGELEESFNRASEQVREQMAVIKEREATLRSVVSNTTHDVALPLTVIQGHLSTLQAALQDDSQAHDAMRGAIRETHYLAALLHNLGVAARLDNAMPVVERRPLNLHDLLERVIARHRPLAKMLDIELEAAVPEVMVWVSADVTLLEQAVSNLVHNAIQYNKRGGHVAVILEMLDAGSRFSLRVIDDGPGIPVEERAHLTDRTFRGTAGRARRPDGQGLGLHIAGQVVERHGFGLRFGESDFGGAEVEITGACVESRAV